MGWLGWSYRQALKTDVNVIALALEGRTELLRSIFGDPDSQNRRPRGPVTAQRFRHFARQHNLRYADRARRQGGGAG